MFTHLVFYTYLVVFRLILEFRTWGLVARLEGKGFELQGFRLSYLLSSQAPKSAHFQVCSGLGLRGLGG